jgi:hypothetical protein
MKAVGFAETLAETNGLIAAASMLVFMCIGSLLADTLNRRMIFMVSVVVFFFYLIEREHESRWEFGAF